MQTTWQLHGGRASLFCVFSPFPCSESVEATVCSSLGHTTPSSMQPSSINVFSVLPGSQTVSWEFLNSTENSYNLSTITVSGRNNSLVWQKANALIIGLDRDTLIYANVSWELSLLKPLACRICQLVLLELLLSLPAIILKNINSNKILAK